jgi:hypothetical protein
LRPPRKEAGCVEAFDRWRGNAAAVVRLDRLLRHVGPLVHAAL